MWIITHGGFSTYFKLYVAILNLLYYTNFINNISRGKPSLWNP